jgi:hypothetical protein
MKLRSIGLAMAVLTLGSAASAAELTILSRGQPGRAVARLVDQGIGYSVAHEPAGRSPRGYRVHVTCTIDESFAQTYCPTAGYVSSCPRARIACR